ncbi:MAG: hypothetical protein FJX67_19140 [Alphaproteobacteria bacterium]|nr:hypothetical protein [Alphaproteobacteria bacterium]
MSLLTLDRTATLSDRIGPPETVALAVLGVASFGPIEIDRLVPLVQGLVAAPGRPTTGFVLSTIVSAIADRTLATVDGGVAPPAVQLTADGHERLRDLLKIGAGDPSDPLFRTRLVLKVAFLDTLPPIARWAVVDDLVRRVDAARARSDGQATVPGQRYFREALGCEQRRLEADAAWLRALSAEIAATLPAGS